MEAKDPFIMQAVLLLVAAALFAATIYMILGRVIAMLNSAHQSLVPVKWLTKIFVLGDVISFFMQGIGASVRAADQSKADISERIIIAGLFVQIAFFGVFMVVTALFQWKIWKTPCPEAQALRFTPSKWFNWQMLLYTLFACSLLILVRCIIRAVEYIEGYDGYLISNEVFLYTLDLLLMFINMVLLCWQDVCGYFAEVGPVSRDEKLLEGSGGGVMEGDPFKDETEVGSGGVKPVEL